MITSFYLFFDVISPLFHSVSSKLLFASHSIIMIALWTLSDSILSFFQVRIPCLYALSLHGHLQERTLDAVVPRKDLPMPDMCVGLPGEFSDHSLLISQFQLPRPPVCFVDVSTRAWKSFNEDSFRRELQASGLCFPLTAYSGIPVDELQERYDTTLRTLLEEHAPCRTARHRCQPTTPGSMPTVPRSNTEQGLLNGGIGRRSWILIDWSGMGKPGRNNCSPPNKISSGGENF